MRAIKSALSLLQPVITERKQIRFDHAGRFITEYINSPEGVRQNFIIKTKPEGNAENPVSADVGRKDWLVNLVNKQEIHLAMAQGIDNKVTYKD
ncbi:MAG: hypothetical protein IPI66_11255 [Chitinophagaceae bacterium]|nr:hypothetical protein [Chitinophagaceae bacterium]